MQLHSALGALLRKFHGTEKVVFKVVAEKDFDKVARDFFWRMDLWRRVACRLCS